MAIKSTSLVTLAAAKAYCNIPTATTDWDAVIEILIDAVSSLVDNYVGRVLALTTYTAKLLDGSGREKLILPFHPVASITSVKEDDVTLTLGDEADYLRDLTLGILYRVGGSVWAAGRQNIEITYKAGYVVQGGTVATGETALPDDLKLAALMQVAAEWKRHQQGDWNEVSRSFPDGSVSKRNEDPILPQVKAILDRYRDIRV
jgi:hypothetical protein